MNANFGRIYIGCALTHVPRSFFAEYTAFIHSLAAGLTQAFSACEVKYALTHSDPQLASKPFNERARLCYLWDKTMVEECELIIADVSFPSTGLGAELQIAQSKGIPAILCFRDFAMNRAAPVSYETPDRQTHALQIGEGYVSLMALGMPNVFRVAKYRDTADGVQQVVDAALLCAAISSNQVP